jgi:sugar (pentulose or hexulose) kinase
MFIGNEHEEQVKKLARQFNKPADYFKLVTYNPAYVKTPAYVPVSMRPNDENTLTALKASRLNIQLDYSQFATYEEAYHELMQRITEPQVEAIRLAAEYNTDGFEYLLVDGGFSKNKIFMHLLQNNFPDLNIVISENSQGTALGAAMLMNVW